MKTLGVCLALSGGVAQASDFDLRLDLDEVNTLARTLPLPAVRTSRQVGYGWLSCTVEAAGVPDSVELYQAGDTLRYRIRGELQLSGSCVPDATRAFIATGTLMLRTVGTTVRLHFGTTRVEVGFQGVTFGHDVTLSPVDLPLPPMTVQTRAGHRSEVGVIGQRMRVEDGTISVRGNTWVR
jgi:hypothetical protein